MHSQRIHPGLKMRYKSLRNKNVMDLFKNASDSDAQVEIPEEQEVPDEQKVPDKQEVPDDKPRQEITSKRESEGADSENPPKKKKISETIRSNCDLNKELLEQILKTVTSK